MTSEARTGTQAHSITYQYDLAGNITQKNGSSFGTYDDANKMTHILGSSFSPFAPDADGNQRQIKSNGYPFTSTTLTYDSRNKLVTADTGTPEWAYRYDGFGRRVYRQNHITTPTSRRYYVYAGDTIVGEIDDGVPTVAYTVGPDGMASRRLLTGTPSSRFYCYGPQGETRNLTDEFQTVTSTYFYEAYGKPLGTSPTEYNPYRYGGKFGYYTDNEIQTLQVGARWYSPHLIRWMSRDPIHYRGGGNLSAYVMGNPVKFVDPSGLQSLPSNVREMFEPYFPRKVLEEAYFRQGMPWFGPSEDDARGFAPNWNVYIDKATYDRLFHKNGPQCSESDYELIAHELTHVEQYWANPIFKLDYAFKHLRYGYRRNPMEKEANEKARNIIESLKEGKHDLRP